MLGQGRAPLGCCWERRDGGERGLTCAGWAVRETRSSRGTEGEDIGRVPQSGRCCRAMPCAHHQF